MKIVLTLSVFLLLWPMKILAEDPEFVCADCSDVRQEKCATSNRNADNLIKDHVEKGKIAKLADGEDPNSNTAACFHPQYKVIEYRDSLCMPDESNVCQVIALPNVNEVESLRQSICSACFQSCDCQKGGGSNHLLNVHSKALLSLSIWVIKYMI